MFWMTSFAVHTEIVSSNEVGCLEAQHDVGEVDDEGTRSPVLFELDGRELLLRRRRPNRTTLWWT